MLALLVFARIAINLLLKGVAYVRNVYVDSGDPKVLFCYAPCDKFLCNY